MFSPDRHLAKFNIAHLEHLKAHGESDYAFGWEQLPAAQHWKMARSAPTTGSREHAA